MSRVFVNALVLAVLAVAVQAHLPPPLEEGQHNGSPHAGQHGPHGLPQGHPSLLQTVGNKLHAAKDYLQDKAVGVGHGLKEFAVKGKSTLGHEAGHIKASLKDAVEAGKNGHVGEAIHKVGHLAAEEALKAGSTLKAQVGKLVGNVKAQVGKLVGNVKAHGSHGQPHGYPHGHPHKRHAPNSPAGHHGLKQKLGEKLHAAKDSLHHKGAVVVHDLKKLAAEAKAILAGDKAHIKAGLNAAIDTARKGNWKGAAHGVGHLAKDELHKLKPVVKAQLSKLTHDVRGH